MTGYEQTLEFGMLVSTRKSPPHATLLGRLGGFHGMWPAWMVMDLCKSLPEQYTAEPRVHLGKNFEVDVCTFDVERENGLGSSLFGSGAATAGATATWAPPEPTLSLELDPTEIYEYEVLIPWSSASDCRSCQSGWKTTTPFLWISKFLINRHVVR